MIRREFIILLGGAAAAWPLAAHAQQASKLPTIGFLGATTPSAGGQLLAAFVQRLRELGWVEGRNVAIESRWAEGRGERFAEIAAEFVRLKVDVILTHNTPPALAAKHATSIIPIVFATGGDPVGTGVVASLARPGGNVTGLSSQNKETAGKRIELLREIVPGLRRLAILASDSPYSVLEITEVQAAARTVGLEVAAFEIRRTEDIAPVFEKLKGRAGALPRPGHSEQSSSHQHIGARRAIADDACCPGPRRSRRSDVLWTKLVGHVPARRRLCRQDSARSEAGRPPGRAADQIRSRRESHNREGARPRSAANTARPRRRGDRVM
jgi:ABC-type uncharacterized transport system substrate-binding protein